MDISWIRPLISSLFLKSLDNVSYKYEATIIASLNKCHQCMFFKCFARRWQTANEASVEVLAFVTGLIKYDG